MTIEEAKNSIGRRVQYIPFKGCDPSLIEQGTITSTNDKYVFVRYDGDVNSKATRPEDLNF